MPDGIDAREAAPTRSGDVAMTRIATFDPKDLETKVKTMYTDVARDPHGEFHFEMGRTLAERLGYPPADLDRIPPEAIESFAGVGYFFPYAELKEGETAVDFGSGSGMDCFLAALKVGRTGKVIGVDMTDAQREKAGRLRDRYGFDNVSFVAGHIESPPLRDGSADAVISNGVFNLSPDKARVFREAARVLAPGGRLALADIVTEVRLPESIVCNATLWAACIGGAAQQDDYRGMIEASGLRVVRTEENGAYAFLSDNARGASRKFGVKSISLLAVKP
jgi:arsenite methyltransferase